MTANTNTGHNGHNGWSDDRPPANIGDYSKSEIAAEKKRFNTDKLNALDRIWDNPKVRPLAFKLAQRLISEHLNKWSGRARPSQETLAKAMKISVRHVNRLARELKEAGEFLIKPGHGRGQGEGRYASEYRVVGVMGINESLARKTPQTGSLQPDSQVPLYPLQPDKSGRYNRTNRVFTTGLPGQPNPCTKPVMKNPTKESKIPAASPSGSAAALEDSLAEDSCRTDTPGRKEGSATGRQPSESARPRAGSDPVEVEPPAEIRPRMRELIENARRLYNIPPRWVRLGDGRLGCRLGPYLYDDETCKHIVE